MIGEDIPVDGVTTIFVNDNPFRIKGGGEERRGVPPTVIAPYEPLWMGMVSQKINGEDSDKFGYAEINGTSTIDVTVELTFSGEPVPDGTPVFVVIGNNDGLSKLISENSLVFVYWDEQTRKSLVDIKILPTEVPEETFTEIVKIISKYDESGEVEREKIVSLVVKVLSEEDDEEDEKEDPFDQVDEPESFSVFSGSLERYNTSSGIWSTVREMNEPRGNIVFEFYRTDLYAIGGINKNIISGTNERYNLPKDSWTEMASMPTSRFGSMSVVVNGIIYVIGGIMKDPQTQKNTVSRKIEAYDVEIDVWNTLEDMSVIWNGFEDRSYGVCFGCAKHINVNGEDRIYVISGGNKIDDDEVVTVLNDRILYYSINSDRWFSSNVFSGLDLTLYRRFAFNYFLDGNDIIVVNGTTHEDDGSYQLVQDSFSYNVISETISLYDGNFSTFPVLKSFSASVTDNLDPSNIISHYFLGGTNSDSDNLKLVEKITSNSVPLGYSTVANMIISKTGVGATIGTIDDNDSIDPSNDDPSGIYRYLGIPHIFVVGGYISGREDNFLKITLQFNL